MQNHIVHCTQMHDMLGLNNIGGLGVLHPPAELQLTYAIELFASWSDHMKNRVVGGSY